MTIYSFIQTKAGRINFLWIPRDRNLKEQPDPGIVAAALMVKVVNKEPLFAILEDDSHHAETSFNDGMAFFDHLTDPPVKEPEVGHLVAYSEEQSRFHTGFIIPE
jgi:hypothetical protein